MRQTRFDLAFERQGMAIVMKLARQIYPSCARRMSIPHLTDLLLCTTDGITSLPSSTALDMSKTARIIAHAINMDASARLIPKESCMICE